jgi:hypothetical protein
MSAGEEFAVNILKKCKRDEVGVCVPHRQLLYPALIFSPSLLPQAPGGVGATVRTPCL